MESEREREKEASIDNAMFHITASTILFKKKTIEMRYNYTLF